jgi:tetratricopeptide (TPR) repeat protein
MASDYDRSKLVARAERARKARRTRTAIALYRQVLAVDRELPEIHAKLAPLLARTRQSFDALLSFRAAAEGFMRTNQSDRALATCHDATHHLPRNSEVWQTLSRMQRARGKPDEAARTLLEGRARLTRRSDRAQAIHLLRTAHEMDAWNPAIVLDLAKLLARTQQRAEALLLLEGLAHRVAGRARLRARGRILRLQPRPHHLWLWLRELRRSARRANAEPPRTERRRLAAS